MINRHRTIWFALMSMLLVSLYRTASKYGGIFLRKIKGAESDGTGA